MLRRSFLTAALIVLAGALAPAIPAAAAADPAAMISNLGSRALEVLGKDATQAQRVARFRELLREDFDVPGIGRFVLGRYWNTGDRGTAGGIRQAVRGLHRDGLRHPAGRIHRRDLQGDAAAGRSADGAIVSSQILRPAGAAPVKVDWRLTGRDGNYKISDVSVDGISMAVTQRSEFASVIQHNGGQVQGLITMLREKTAGNAAR